MGRFSYYRRLSRRGKAIYRRSDEITDVPLPDLGALQRRAEAVRAALARDDRVAVEGAATRLVGDMLRALEVEPLAVRVLATRPRSASSELHGLYTREPGRRPVIQVWMRTAEHRRVVAFRTFLRTLMHEVCHHLDYTLFGLQDSYHTEGFFRRESSLVRQLAGRGRGKRTAGAAAPRDRPPAEEPTDEQGEGGSDRQLELPLS
jgi:hypothetical protein